MWIAITAAAALSVGLVIGALAVALVAGARGMCVDPAAHEELELEAWREREA